MKQAYDLHAVHTTILKKKSVNHTAIISINYTTSPWGKKSRREEFSDPNHISSDFT